MSCEIVYEEGIFSATLRLLQNVEKEVILISPWFVFEEPIKKLLISKISGGIKVTVVTRKSTDEGHIEAINELEKSGAIVYDDRLLYGKIIIFDRKFAIVGSASLQERATLENRELAIVTEDSNQIDKILEYVKNLEEISKIKILGHAEERDSRRSSRS
jgi:phosphatidylserine/phosphatidylglycerophosphate/cardiolipin synthase-like enzyme